MKKSKINQFTIDFKNMTIGWPHIVHLHIIISLQLFNGEKLYYSSYYLQISLTIANAFKVLGNPMYGMITVIAEIKSSFLLPTAKFP